MYVCGHVQDLTIMCMFKLLWDGHALYDRGVGTGQAGQAPA